jgi:FKBP-type peptidyl-prolyl cis-trans isomerase SlyD
MEIVVNNEQKPTKVADDVVVSMEYILRIDGVIVDSSDEEGPLEFLQGKGNIIKGLETALYGMKPGDKKRVVVAPTDAYGEYEDEAVIDVSRREFPPDIPLKPDVELEVTDDDGDTQFARIVKVSKSSVTLDFNHPMAGKTLDFDVTILELRQPTAEELDHGHVHTAEGHGHGDTEEYDFEDFDEDDFDEELDDDEELVYEDEEFDELDEDDLFDEDEED